MPDSLPGNRPKNLITFRLSSRRHDSQTRIERTGRCPGQTAGVDRVIAEIARMLCRSRFGCGPSKVRPEQIDAIVARASSVMGTSHRQAPVKDIVGSVRDGLMSLFDLPEGWEIVLGNGGSTVFWDIATFGLVRDRSEHYVFGEFSSKFAEASAAAPHLGEPVVVQS